MCNEVFYGKNLYTGYQCINPGTLCRGMFEDNEVVLPMTVLEELDNLKKEEGEKGANVRKAIRILETH